MNSNQSKSLKLTAVIFMGMTAAMNLLGGIGTVCAAFIKKWAIVLGVMKLREFDYTWLYKIFMFVAIIIGILGIWATIKLVKGGKGVFRNALIILFIGTLASGIHFYASVQIRGEATPANMKFFTNLLALIIFLVLNAPGLREKVDFSKPGGDAEKTGGGLAAILAGLLTLTTFFWVGESHVYLGESWVNDLDITLIVLGTGFLVFGLGLITSVVLGKVRQSKEKSAVDMS